MTGKLQATSKTAGNSSSPRPKPAYDASYPKSVGPRPSSSSRTIAKGAGSPPTGGTSRAVAALGIVVPMFKVQAVPITSAPTGRASNPSGTFAAVALLSADRQNNIARVAAIPDPIDGVRPAPRAKSIGQGATGRRLIDGMAYHPEPSAEVPAPLALVAGSTSPSVQLVAGV